jgi:hypothetical protein
MKKNLNLGPRVIKKITLHRETIARLTFTQLERARGGERNQDTSYNVSCKETATTCLRESDECV